MVDWIFWDNDGVLVETEHLYFRAGREILADVGIGLTQEAFVQISLKQGRSVLDLAVAAGMSPGDMAHLQERRNRRYGDLLQTDSRVIDGVAETLQRLSGTVSMGIVTSSRRTHFDIIHRHSGLLPFFNFVITCEDVSRTKPHPEPYLKALAVSGSTPDRCLVVEDTERGLISATRAGMDCAVIPNGMLERRDFAAASCVLHSVRDIPGLVS
jgi:HAD superfamily hydrolase (TIGR01509 family)